jgi:large conductance mechanosensitive channel
MVQSEKKLEAPEEKTGLIGDFKTFLEEYKIVSVAVAFVMGQAVNDLVKSFVTNIFMPMLDPLIPEGDWKTATYRIGEIQIGWGPFLSNLVYFTLLAIIIFVAVRKLMPKIPEVAKTLPALTEKLRKKKKSGST